jgi:uncharacterized protein YbaA (DUF1428 family)
MAYVEGFLVPVKTARFAEYAAIAQKGAAIWKELGALAVLEARADNAPYGELTSFPRAVMIQPDEEVVFSYILFRDRTHRDSVMEAAMQNKAFMAMMDTDVLDGKRMVWGGFQSFVDE